MAAPVGDGIPDASDLVAFGLALFLAFGFTRLAQANSDSPSPAQSAADVSETKDELQFRAVAILRANCQNCHGSTKQQGGLRLDSLAALLAGGDSGPALVPHEPDKSSLIAAIRYDQDRRMPPKGRLGPDDIAVLTRWVQRGAPWTATAGNTKEAEKSAFWSFQPVTDPPLPAVQDGSWPKNDLDRFVLARLEKQGLKPAEPADKLTLLRRVTFDLIGLPPTREEIAAFLSDHSPEAYARVVDRLLASPHYGENWARHWLDLVCFAETDNDRPKLNAYRYRDYVIDAFNEDLPYNRFVAEHFAGDLLEPRHKVRGSQLASPVATGFLWLREFPPPKLITDKEVDRADYAADQIDVVGKAFLGLTLACARCHNHKFDPISQEDYYALAGILYSSQMTSRPINPPTDPAETANIRERIDALCRQIKRLQLQAAGNEGVANLAKYLRTARVLLTRKEKPSDLEIKDQAAWEKLDGDLLSAWTAYLGRPGLIRDPVFGPWAEACQVPPEVFAKQFGRLLACFRRENAGARSAPSAQDLVFAKLEHPLPASLEAVALRYQSMVQDALGAFAGEQADRAQNELVDHLLGKGTPLDARLRKAPDSSALAPLRAELAQLQEQEAALALCTSEGKLENVHVNLAGNPKNLGREVPRGFLKLLAGSAPPAVMGSGRASVAALLADEHNPLTGRVMVNRSWQHLFGNGLVRTPSDFGAMGETPSHPELLDYLTRRFVESGWSLKALHRLLALSNTYQMASLPSEAALAADPENKLLQHMPLRRLNAESVRDSILLATGTLNRQTGGPSVPTVDGGGPVDGKGRRSIYLQVHRSLLTPMLLAFDFPRPTSSVGKRYSTSLPAQALVLLNDEFVHQQAQQWAKQIAAQTDGIEQRVDGMFRAALGRPPTESETAAALRFLERQQMEYEQQHEAEAWRALADLAHCLFNLDQFLLLQ